MDTEELLWFLCTHSWFLLQGPVLIPKSVLEDIYHRFLPWDLIPRRFGKGIKISSGIFLKIHVFFKDAREFSVIPEPSYHLDNTLTCYKIRTLTNTRTMFVQEKCIWNEKDWVLMTSLLYFQVAWSPKSYFTYLWKQILYLSCVPNLWFLLTNSWQKENKNAMAQIEDGKRAFCVVAALPADY